VIEPDSFRTPTLDAHPRGAAVRRILAASVRAVEPGAAVRRFFRKDGRTLVIADEAFDLSSFRRVALLGFGKASVAMAEAVFDLLGDVISEALVISKHAPRGGRRAFHIVEGGHPVPDEKSLEAGHGAVRLLSRLESEDLLICLISGGGSALMAAPVEGVGLADLQALTGTLLACGADIEEVNILRRRLDVLKGGGVVDRANGAAVVSLILSDVIGNPLEAVASGPTVPDPSRRSDASSILEKYGIDREVPAAVRRALERDADPPRGGGRLFERVRNVVVADNRSASTAGIAQAAAEDFQVVDFGTALQGEARDAGASLAAVLRGIDGRSGRPICMVAGGETTVTVRGKGRGGRNTELALAAAVGLSGLPDALLVSLATDGEDGPTDAAGAVATGETCRRAEDLGLNAADHLRRNDSYSYFSELGDLLRPGPTGTNVNDLAFLFRFSWSAAAGRALPGASCRPEGERDMDGGIVRKRRMT
jgi:glycerate 2-kinase